MMMTTKGVIFLVGCSKRSPTEGETKTRNSKKKPAQTQKNDNRATQDAKVQEGICVAGPFLTRAQAKKTDKIRPLKVKEAMSSIDKTAIEDLQKKFYSEEML